MEDRAGVLPGRGQAAAGQVGLGEWAIHEHAAEQFQPAAGAVSAASADGAEIDEGGVAKLFGSGAVHSFVSIRRCKRAGDMSMQNPSKIGRSVMTSLWKWLGLAACGVGLLVAGNRMQVVTASEEGRSYGESDDSSDKLDRIAEKLDRLLNRIDGRMGPGGPHHGPDHARHHGRPPHDGPHHDRAEWGGPPRGPQRELPPEAREMLEKRMQEGRERMQQAREEMKERMEKAREKFRELEERVKSLEAEVEQMKAARQG